MNRRSVALAQTLVMALGVVLFLGSVWFGVMVYTLGRMGYLSTVMVVAGLVSAGITCAAGVGCVAVGGAPWPLRVSRSARRVLRGRCPKCNYDLRGELDMGCSECAWNRRGNARNDLH